MQAGEFIYEQPIASDIEYVFNQALTQEVAYNSVLTERRRLLHERIGAALESIYAESLNAHLSELAHHYSRTSNIPKAVHFLKLAAKQAESRSAIVDSERQLRDAIGLMMALPASLERDLLELELQTALGAVLVGRGWGAPEREQPLRRAYELCERVGDRRQVLPALYQLNQFYIEQMRLREARKLAQRAVTSGLSAGDPILESGAWHNLSETYFWAGDVQTAWAHAERAIAICDNIPPETLIRACGFDQWIVTAALLGWTNLILGRPDQSIRWEQRLVERARPGSQPYSMARMFFAGFSAQLRGDLNAAGEYAAPARQVSDEYGFHEISAGARQVAGWASFWRGERAPGIAEMKDAAERLPALGTFITLSWSLALLAGARVELGDWQAAEATCAEAFDLIKNTKERWSQAELHRVAAAAILATPGADLGAAEEQLHKAIELAQKQGAKWWELLGLLCGVTCPLMSRLPDAEHSGYSGAYYLIRVMQMALLMR